jgi:hypothetical protein
VIREESKWKIGDTYWEGRIVIVADGSLPVVCCPKSDCDDGAGADLPGIMRRAWRECVVEREAVTKMGVWTLGSRIELDRMESVGLQEVMACVAAEDTDHAG